MNVHVDTFFELVGQEWNYPGKGNGSKKTQIWLRSPNMDITGGKIQKEDIDKLADFPDIKSVTISGLNQNTFEYFIYSYGKQLRFIEFFKNKAVEDWSLLGTLSELECVHWFHNQKITQLWDMSENYALRAVILEDFTKLHSIIGIDKAPNLEWFGFGDAVWSTSVLDSLNPFRGTKIKRIDFYGKIIRDMDVSVLPNIEHLEVFNFPPNHFSTEEVAWMVAKCPHLKGRALKPYIDGYTKWDKETKTDVPAVTIVGKRKPFLIIEGNEKRIANYIAKFNELVEAYKKS